MVTPKQKKDILDVFTAGWNAAYRLQYHEWGPSPPTTPELALIEWMNTCANHHLTFEIFDGTNWHPDPPKCASCDELLKRGKFSM